MSDKKLTEGLTLWQSVSTPQHEHTKSFSRAGGFKGTSISVTAMAMMATEMFGPNGIGWGLELEDEKYIDGAPILSGNGDVLATTIVHVVRAHVWYVIDGKKYQTSPQFGQTTFVGKDSRGIVTDEEAPKKSISDAQNKCLSLLGFASDIFLGKWDDNKYLDGVKQDQQAEKTFKANKEAAEAFIANFPNILSNCETLEDIDEYGKANLHIIRAFSDEDRQTIKTLADQRRAVLSQQEAA